MFIGALLLALVVVFSDVWMSTVAAVHPALPWSVYALAAVGGLVGFAAVFLYKNRNTQAKVVASAQWLDLALILVLVVVLGTLSFDSDRAAPTSPLIYIVLLLPVGAYILFSLARRAVKKDIELVRSMDRLR